ncbi:twin-arginine translocase subunit TatC [Siminovitchia acidinfaciens]|uniref:Sec-independent protein translocase protein TatC n=1 Tax=Siminovitchia acidinfaciens TaxID=2321395 RepID=A0A429Y4C1_9BACI|nr:twin-arginine translocase subunit TatC [Siminovitchia acidinfaciens]RST76272.1 twin-arginine translocase subunit TatC [Siminovitchia acidinfaciens]
MDQKQMNLIGHLDELRKRIIMTLVAFVLAFVLSFAFAKDLYQFLVKDLEGKLALLGPGDIIWIYMMISGVMAIAVTLPIAAFEVWQFVKPALTKKEQKITMLYIPSLFFLFSAGLAFGYFIIFPLVLSFLTNLSGDLFQTFFTAEKYFRFMLNLVVPLGFLFEMPAVVMFLTRLGIIDPHKLAKARKVAYFILIVISILITPPDFISDVLVIIPLLLLYELSITLSKMVFRKGLSSTVSVTAN